MTKTQKTYITNYVIKNVKNGGFFHVTFASLADSIQVASRFPYGDTARSVAARLGEDYRVIKVCVDKQTGFVTIASDG